MGDDMAGAKNLAATKKFHNAVVDANLAYERVAQLLDNRRRMLKANEQALPKAQADLKELMDTIASIKAKVAESEKAVAAAKATYDKAKRAEMDAEKAYESSAEGKAWQKKNGG